MVLSFSFVPVFLPIPMIYTVKKQLYTYDELIVFSFIRLSTKCDNIWMEDCLHLTYSIEMTNDSNYEGGIHIL